jgi:hypothetical protein
LSDPKIFAFVEVGSEAQGLPVAGGVGKLAAALTHSNEKGRTMAYLEITLKVEEHNRAKAAAVYGRFREPFLKSVSGAKSKELLVRGEDVQVLHGFDTVENAMAYTKSQLFQDDVVVALKPLLAAAPEIRFYQVA